MAFSIFFGLSSIGFTTRVSSSVFSIISSITTVKPESVSSSFFNIVFFKSIKLLLASYILGYFVNKYKIDFDLSSKSSIKFTNKRASLRIPSPLSPPFELNKATTFTDLAFFIPLIIPKLFAISISGPSVSPYPGASHKFIYSSSWGPITSFKLTITGLIYLVSDWFKQLLLTPINEGLFSGIDTASIWCLINLFSAISTLTSPILQPAKNWIVVDFPVPVSPIKRTMSWPEIMLLPSAAFDTSLIISWRSKGLISFSSFLKAIILSEILVFIFISFRILPTAWELSSCFSNWSFKLSCMSSRSSLFIGLAAPSILHLSKFRIKTNATFSAQSGIPDTSWLMISISSINGAWMLISFIGWGGGGGRGRPNFFISIYIRFLKKCPIYIM